VNITFDGGKPIFSLLLVIFRVPHEKNKIENSTIEPNSAYKAFIKNLPLCYAANIGF
jgi:hypothetical protein